MKRGKRYLAALMIVAMVFANVGPGVWAALNGPEKDVLFEIEASDLIGEIEEAAVGKLEMGDVEYETIDGEAGMFWKTFVEGGGVYELTPRIQGGRDGVELRLFVRLPDLPDELEEGYRVTGDEELLLLYTNETPDTVRCRLKMKRTGEDGEEYIRVTDNVVLSGYEAFLDGAKETEEDGSIQASGSDAAEGEGPGVEEDENTGTEQESEVSNGPGEVQEENGAFESKDESEVNGDLESIQESEESDSLRSGQETKESIEWEIAPETEDHWETEKDPEYGTFKEIQPESFDTEALENKRKDPVNPEESGENTEILLKEDGEEASEDLNGTQTGEEEEIQTLLKQETSEKEPEQIEENPKYEVEKEEVSQIPATRVPEEEAGAVLLATESNAEESDLDAEEKNSSDIVEAGKATESNASPPATESNAEEYGEVSNQVGVDGSATARLCRMSLRQLIPSLEKQFQYEYEGEGIYVLVELPKDTSVPAGAKLFVKRITEENDPERLRQRKSQFAEAYGGDGEALDLYDIGFYVKASDAEEVPGVGEEGDEAEAEPELERFFVPEEAKISICFTDGPMDVENAVSVVRFGEESSRPRMLNILRIDEAYVNEIESLTFCMEDLSEFGIWRRGVIRHTGGRGTGCQKAMGMLLMLGAGCLLMCQELCGKMAGRKED